MKVCEIKVNYLYTTIENKPKSYREKSDSTDILGIINIKYFRLNTIYKNI